MSDHQYVQSAIELWHLLSEEDRFDLVDEWISSGALLTYIYEELHYTDDAGVEYEESMDYQDIEEIYLYRCWIPKYIKDLAGD